MSVTVTALQLMFPPDTCTTSSPNYTQCLTQPAGGWAYGFPGTSATLSSDRPDFPCCAYNQQFLYEYCPNIGDLVSHTYFNTIPAGAPNSYGGTYGSTDGTWQLYQGDAFARCQYNVTSGQITPEQVQAFINNRNQITSLSDAPTFDWDTNFNNLMYAYCSQENSGTGGTGSACPAQIGIVGYDASTPRVGCSKLISDSLCQQWRQTGNQQLVNAAQNNFCANRDVNQYSECSCINPTNNPIFQKAIQYVNKDQTIFGSTNCWWPPCQGQDNAVIFQQQDVSPVTCPNVCQINGNNVVNNVIDCFDQQNNNNGGGGNGNSIFDNPWFWVGAFIVLIFVIVVIGLFSYSRRR